MTFFRNFLKFSPEVLRFSQDFLTFSENILTFYISHHFLIASRQSFLFNVSSFRTSNHYSNIQTTQKKTSASSALIFSLFAWQRPTLTGGQPPTTIGAEELNFRVRYGNGCGLFAIITRHIKLKDVPSKLDNVFSYQDSLSIVHCFGLSPRSISIRQLHMSPRFHLEPIYLIIFQGSY